MYAHVTHPTIASVRESSGAGCPEANSSAHPLQGPSDRGWSWSHLALAVPRSWRFRLTMSLARVRCWCWASRVAVVSFVHNAGPSRLSVVLSFAFVFGFWSFAFVFDSGPSRLSLVTVLRVCFFFGPARLVLDFIVLRERRMRSSYW